MVSGRAGERGGRRGVWASSEPLGLTELADLVAELGQVGDRLLRVLGRRGGRKPQPGAESPELLAVAVDHHPLGLPRPVRRGRQALLDLPCIQRIAESLELVGPAQVRLGQVEPVDRRGLGQLEHVLVEPAGELVVRSTEFEKP